MFKKLIDFWVRPEFKNYDWVNITFYCVTLGFGALFGSVVSVFVASAGIYTSLHLLTGRLRWALPHPVKTVYLAFCGFFAAELIAGLVHPSLIVLNEVAENLPFLGMAGIYSITFVDRRKLLQAVEVAAAASAIVSAMMLTVEFGDQYRPELSAGNASVLALLAGVLFVLTVGAAVRRSNLVALIYMVAAACAGYLVIVTGTRGILPVLILIPVMSIFFFWSRKQILWGLPALIILLGGLTALSMGLSKTLEDRIEIATVDIRDVLSGDMSGSIGQRVQIYKAGYQLLLEKPVLGYGPGNERLEIANKTLENGGEAISFSHAHNAALTAMLRAGVFGLLAVAGMIIVPFVVAFRATKDEVGQVGFFALSGLLVVYLSSGLTGLMIGQDIHDAVFIAGICYSLYLVFGRADEVQ